MNKEKLKSHFTISQIGCQNSKTHLLLFQVNCTNLIVKWSSL